MIIFTWNKKPKKRMFQLTYSSIASSDFNILDIQEMLRLIKASNFKDQVTGCLLYNNNQFIQIIEGKKIEVLKLFAKIKEDDRHLGINFLHSNDVKERIFSSWNTGFNKLDIDQAQMLLSNGKFEDSTLDFSKLIDQPTEIILIFWEKVKQIIVAAKA